MKRALAIRHVAFEDLGVLPDLLRARGFNPSYHDAGVDRLDDLALAPDDLLIVLGGPIGAYEEDRYPFLADELRLIEQCLRDSVPVVGICLGAQLIARALGARVYPGAAKEIGIAPVTLTAAGLASCLRHLGGADNQVLHWHGDTFDLPVGVARLASTAITPNQAFSVGTRVLALQFHIEADPTQLERWLIGHASELSAAGIDVAALRAQFQDRGPATAAAGAKVVQEWLAAI
jgi:GMP synthase (glutamine-hydrolysing)